MKKLSRFLTILLVLSMLAALSVCAYAEAVADTEDEYIGSRVTLDYALERAWQQVEDNKGKSLSQIAQDNGVGIWQYNPYAEDVPPDPQLKVTKDQTWDEVINMLLEKYDVAYDMENRLGNITIGYYNTVTGEEHYYNPDTYLVSASVFKVPLNMIFADMVYNGEITLDTHISAAETYDYFQYRSIVHSDNERSYMLMLYLGGYNSFKDKQIQYLGSDPSEELGYTYYLDNYYKPTQIINCLKMIYAEPDRFDGILQNMLEATPFEYLKMFQRDYPVAQKYGFVGQNESNGYHTYINIAGVIYTDEPILVTVFTDNIAQAYDVIGEFSVLMCDYTNYRTQEHIESDKAAYESALAEVKSKDFSDFEELPEIVSAENAEAGEPVLESHRELNMSITSFMIIIGILVLMLIGFVAVFRHNRAARVNSFWTVMAIIAAGAAAIACVVAASFGTVYAQIEENPQDTVNTFFSSICSGDYKTAYSCLSDYSSLGLENEASTEEGKLLYDALKQSYSYSFSGDCEVKRLSATQPVYFRYLDLESLESNASGRVEAILNKLVEDEERDDLYDEDGNYRPEIIEEVYTQALTAALENPSTFYKSAEFDVELAYDGEKWLMKTNSDLISALLGGAV